MIKVSNRWFVAVLLLLPFLVAGPTGVPLAAARLAAQDTIAPPADADAAPAEKMVPTDDAVANAVPPAAAAANDPPPADAAANDAPPPATAAIDAPPADAAADDAAMAAAIKAIAESDLQVGVTPQIIAPEIRFNFAGANWKDVITWFSEQADLSLQADQYPAGTINFRDPTRAYSVSEGLDVLNHLLLDRGFALVRSGRILKLIDLETANAAALLSEFAELVLPDDLDVRGRSDIVRSLFPLGSMTPDSAKVELAQLIGPAGRVIVLDSARQVIVTETVDKLIAIRELLHNATETQSNVVEILLKNRAADELLELARPLLGLEPGINSSEDLRLSVGVYGDRIYATGVPSKVSLLESIVKRADTPLQTGSGTNTEVALPVLRTHRVASADPTTVFDVLQTLIAGTPDARISTDPKTKAIIAFARPETQEIIAKTIAELEGSHSEFEIIDLRRLEPSQALLTINKFFGVTAEGGEGPVVDGDPVTGRLWVRGTHEQIELVKNLISKLEGENSLGAMSDRIRILPYNGRSAEEALNQVEMIWPVTGRANRIRTITPSTGRGSTTPGIPERRRLDQRSPNIEETIRDEAPRNDRTNPAGLNEASKVGGGSHYQFVAEQDKNLVQTAVTESTVGQEIHTTTASGADIMIQLTPSGMIVASEDTEALDAFESLMQSVAQQSMAQSSLPTIFWLKYAKADVTAELLRSILGGAESSIDSVGSSIAGSLGGGMLGGLMGMMGGSSGSSSASTSVLTSTGSVSIVADARLNALIIQAGPTDLEFIEMLLVKIDQQQSPEDIETFAKPALIPVIYQSASDVANVVKLVFADKMGSESGGGGNRQQQQPSPQDFIAALRGGGGGGGGGRGGNDAPKSEPSKIIVAVDTRSNSLVVTATPQDFEKVRDLVEALDQQGMESEDIVDVVTLGGGIKADVVQKALESVLGKTTKSTSSSSASTSGSPAAPSGGTPEATSADDIQRRMEFFRQMRERSGGGGSPFGAGGSPFGGGGGGSPFGGGGRPSGGGGDRGGRGGR